MNKTLLSYSLLLLLILTGWLAVSLVPEQNNNSKEAQPPLRSNFQLGNLAYYEKGAPVYSLSYKSSTYTNHWTLASPRLVLNNAQGEDMILSAKTANISDSNEFSFSGEVLLRDRVLNRELKAATAKLNSEQISLQGDAQFNAEEMRLSSDQIQLIRNKKNRIQADGSPLHFAYHSINGEAKTLVYDAPNLLLSGKVSGQDEKLRFSANQVHMTKNTIELSTNAYWQQDDLWLKADSIYLTDEQRLEAKGSPLQFRYQSLNGEAKSLNYINKQLELEQQVVLKDNKNDRHLKAEHIILKEESIEAQGNAELEQQDWTLSGNHIITGKDQEIRADGAPLIVHQQNLTISASTIDYKNSLAAIRGNPLNFQYKHGNGLFYGEGELLETRTDDNQFLLQGVPAKIERSGIDKQRNFNAKAEQIELAQNKLILQSNIHLQTEGQEIKAAYAVYHLDSKDWLVDGKSIDNRPQEQIELIIPR